MDPSSAQHHHQELANSQTLESMLVCTKAQQEKKPRPPEQSLKCPRCDSTSTKFCYYNNYSLSQPRYFCKSCRRYWTKGGTLRNVPVGGGCRKNKRSLSSSTSSSSSSSLSKLRSQDQPLTNNSNPLGSLTPLTYDSSASDLSLAFARLQKQNIGQLGFDDHHDQFPMFGNLGVNTSVAAQLGSFDHGLIRNGFLESTNGFHNLYHGTMSANANMGHVENGGLGFGVGEGMAIPYEELSGATTSSTTLTTMKQQVCNLRDGENRVLWGFPWQIGGDANMVDHLDSSGRQQSWNGFGSSWHGLINSPLM